MKSMNKSFLGASIILAVLSGCASKQAQQPELTLSGLNPANFEVSAENAKPIKLYTLKNSQGMEVCVTNFGGRIVSVMVPDKNGKMTDVVLGFDSIADYQNIPSDFGASIGRYANRINKGKITIDEKGYSRFTSSQEGKHRFLIIDNDSVAAVVNKLVEVSTNIPQNH